jgi:hypothetical protein
MDRVQNPNNTVCYTPSLESFWNSIDYLYCFTAYKIYERIGRSGRNVRLMNVSTKASHDTVPENIEQMNREVTHSEHDNHSHQHLRSLPSRSELALRRSVGVGV